MSLSLSLSFSPSTRFPACRAFYSGAGSNSTSRDARSSSRSLRMLIAGVLTVGRILRRGSYAHEKRFINNPRGEVYAIKGGPFIIAKRRRNKHKVLPARPSRSTLGNPSGGEFLNPCAEMGGRIFGRGRHEETRLKLVFSKVVSSVNTQFPCIHD